MYKCDLVLLAMGFLGPEKYIASELETAMDERGNYKTAPGRYQTNLTGTYAAGGKVFLTSLQGTVFY